VTRIRGHGGDEREIPRPRRRGLCGEGERHRLAGGARPKPKPQRDRLSILSGKSAFDARGHPWLNETIGARWRGASSLLCCPPKTEAALKLHPADIADPAYLQNCGFLITGARSLTPAESDDLRLNLTASSQHP
jgi:hypothetical protein